MYKGKRICVVVPAHNERDRIRHVVDTIPSCVDHVVVVDDASSDDTSAVVHQSGDPRVEVKRHDENQGVGGAILTGHQRALDLDADISVVMAGDGQMDPNYLSLLLDALIDQGYDFAKGNRFLTKGTLEEMPRERIVGNAILTFMTKFASGYWHLFDPQNGYTAISAEALRTIPRNHLKRGYLFENSLLCELNLRGFRAKDVGIPAIYRGQRSGIRAGRFALGASLFLFRRFWRRIVLKYLLRDFHPIALFYLSGSLLLAWGIAFGAYVAYLSLGPPAASVGTVMISILPFLVGFQLVLTAVTLDVWSAPK